MGAAEAAALEARAAAQYAKAAKFEKWGQMLWASIYYERAAKNFAAVAAARKEPF